MMEPMTGRISLRKLAAELGLHSSTVSRALNGHPAIDPKTVRKVKKAVERHGYAPNPDVTIAMRAVRKAGSASLHGIFGVLNLHLEKPDPSRRDFSMPISRGIFRRAERLGWVADVINARLDNISPAKLRTRLAAKNIAGLILLPPPLREQVPDYDLSGLQIVATSPAWNEIPAFANVTTVLPNHWQNGLLLMEELRARGFRRPLFHLHPTIEHRHTDATLSAFLHSQFAEFWEKNIPVHKGPLVAGKFAACFEKFQPDIIIGPDVFVRTFLENDMRFHVPGDVSFVSYGHFVEGVASMDSRPQLIGESAVDILTSMIIHADDLQSPARRTFQILGRFVPGPSLREESAGK